MTAFAKAHFEIADEAVEALRAEPSATDGKASAAAAAAAAATSSLASHQIPGKPTSGRVWKLEPKKFSTVRKGRAWHTSWEEKTEERNRKRGLKEREKALKEENEKEKAEEKRRREQRKKQKLENEKKGEVVQVIRNTAKIKRMSKKQLRALRKS